jgi:predicted CoA-substrate-specific enzyme activase
VVLADDGAVAYAVIPTGWNHKEACDIVLSAAMAKAGISREAVAAVSATGYGRVAVKTAMPVISEIRCHAKGARLHFPEAAGVIDIGGQDSKAIRLDEAGNVADFVMNDKCAAGTGRFIQMVATLLEMDLEAFALAAARGKPARISSMCAVFAESEIVGLLARQTPPDNIAAGVTLSVAERAASLVRRLQISGPCVFSGGLACNTALTNALSRFLDNPVLVAEKPQITGALGAALLARVETIGRDMP